MSRCDKCKKCDDDRCHCRNKCDCNDHHSYHHDYNDCPRPHPMASMSSSMETTMAGDMVSTRDWSKIPAQNAMVGGVYIGCNMSPSDIGPAIQAIAAGVANLTMQIGAGATWAQYETAFGIRKYEGDSDCIFTLKPKPKAWVKSTVTPPAPEGPNVVRDCLARTWVSCDSDYAACEVTRNEDEGTTTYTFKQTLGDGAETGETFSFTIPTIIGLPEFPEKAGTEINYTICYNACTEELTWAEKGEDVRFVTDDEFDGNDFPEGTVLTPQQTCQKIEDALGGDGVVAITGFQKSDGVVTSLTINGEVCQLGGGSGGLPAGGTAGQYLTPDGDGGYEWADLPTGGGGLTIEQVREQLCEGIPVVTNNSDGRPLFCAGDVLVLGQNQPINP